MILEDRNSFKESGYFSGKMYLFVLNLLLLLLVAGDVFARDISFTWAPNSDDPAVDGYNLFYKIGDPGASLDDYRGTTDINGSNPSPVFISGQASDSYVLRDLDDNERYSFVITAYRANIDSIPSASITMNALSTGNTAPVASNSAITVTEDITYSGQLSATDSDGDSLTYALVNNGSRGSANINTSTGQFTYTPTAQISGTDTFTFLVNDGSVDSNVATVSVTISPVNDPPVATASSFATLKNTVYNGQLSGSDPEGDQLTYSVDVAATRGTVVFTNVNTGTFRYTPGNEEVGSDSFTYRVNDGSLNSNSALVQITITETNNPPVANAGSFSTNEDTVYNGALIGSDPDNDTLTYTIVANGTKGVASITNALTGAFRYTPTPGESEADSFTFCVHDGTVNSNIATINVTINEVNEPPTAASASITLTEDNAYSGQLSGSDPDGDSLTFSIVSSGSNGTVVINNAGTGSYTYTPNNNVNGTDSFTFHVNDGAVNSNTATVNVTISPVNDQPTVGNLNVTVAADTPYTGALPANDIDGDDLTYTLLQTGTKGTAVLDNQSTGAFTYTPLPSESGTDTITFRVNDGLTNSATGTVNVTIYEAGTVETVFGDVTGSDHGGTILETFTNVNNDLNSASNSISLYSWSQSVPLRVANTIIMKMDLSAIPAHATVTEARLELYLTSSSGEAEYDTTVHQITGKNPVITEVNGYQASAGDPWSPVPAGTTYNDIPLGLADIAASSGTVTINSQTGYKTWMINGMAQQWIRQPTENYGLLIQGSPANVETGRFFASSENTNAAYRPKLTVRYTTLPPTPELISVEEVAQ